MATLFFMGRNDANVSRVSWKLWRIRRDGKHVTASWGPAQLVKRRLQPRHELQSKTWEFRNEDSAREFEAERIRLKLRDGYERNPKDAAWPLTTRRSLCRRAARSMCTAEKGPNESLKEWHQRHKLLA